MTSLFALLVALAAPTTTADCLAWAKAPKAKPATTHACMGLLLTSAYSGPPTAEALTLDPDASTHWEPELMRTDLAQAKAHIEAACGGVDSPDTLCGRAKELFDSMLSRRLSLHEDVDRGSFAPVLAKVLKGEALTAADLAPGEGMHWSMLTLWRLRNAAYARHGYTFKKADLNDFFYGPRTVTGTEKALLPLPKGTQAKVTLTAVDGANVRLIKAEEAKLKAR